MACVGGQNGVERSLEELADELEARAPEGELVGEEEAGAAADGESEEDAEPGANRPESQA